MEQTRTIGVHYDPVYEKHDTGPHHPESAYRYQVLHKSLEALPKEIVRLGRRTAEVEEILLAHDKAYHDIAKRDIEALKGTLSTGDTTVSKDSYKVSLEATGAMLTAADAIMKGEVNSAYCALRPPGHHALGARGMGFCIFNHIAITARYLQKKHGLKKVAIIDWDVHHGNGTEAIFISDPSVLFISTHQEDIYPGTGQAEVRGRGEGLGFNLNLPLPRASDGNYALKIWDKQITPKINDFMPDFLLVSAGYDARKDDPIGGLNWDDDTFTQMTKRCVRYANKHCNGRILSMLEGGYNPEGLASSSVAHVKALA